jgi:hypothetical protein
MVKGWLYSVPVGVVRGKRGYRGREKRNGVCVMPVCLQEFPCTYISELFFGHMPSKLNLRISMNSVCYKSDTFLNLLPFLPGVSCFYRTSYGHHL